MLVDNFTKDNPILREERVSLIVVLLVHEVQKVAEHLSLLITFGSGSRAMSEEVRCCLRWEVSKLPGKPFFQFAGIRGGVTVGVFAYLLSLSYETAGMKHCANCTALTNRWESPMFV